MYVLYILIVWSPFVLSPSINVHTLLLLRDIVSHAAIWTYLKWSEYVTNSTETLT